MGAGDGEGSCAGGGVGGTGEGEALPVVGTGVGTGEGVGVGVRESKGVGSGVGSRVGGEVDKLSAVASSKRIQWAVVSTSSVSFPASSTILLDIGCWPCAAARAVKKIESFMFFIY